MVCTSLISPNLVERCLSTNIEPLISAFNTTPISKTWLGAFGSTAVNPPGIVGETYSTSPSDQDSPYKEPVVSIPLTTPNSVTKPSSPFAISSVAIPKVFAKGYVPSAIIYSPNIFPEAPTAPAFLITLPLEIVAPLWFLTL